MKPMLPFLAAAASGCIVVPPPGHAPAVGANAALDRPMVEVVGTGSIPAPSVGAIGIATPLPGAASFVVVEAHAEGNPLHASVNPALWLRTRPNRRSGTHAALRAGPVFALGDLAGETDSQMRSVGATTHLQIATATETRNETHRVIAFTVGGDFVSPTNSEFIEANFTETVLIDGEETEVAVLPAPAMYFGADVRGEFPMAKVTDLVLGFGADISILGILPAFDLGLTLGLRVHGPRAMGSRAAPVEPMPPPVEPPPSPVEPPPAPVEPPPQ